MSRGATQDLLTALVVAFRDDDDPDWRDNPKTIEEMNDANIANCHDDQLADKIERENEWLSQWAPKDYGDSSGDGESGDTEASCVIL